MKVIFASSKEIFNLQTLQTCTLNFILINLFRTFNKAIFTKHEFETIMLQAFANKYL